MTSKFTIVQRLKVLYQSQPRFEALVSYDEYMVRSSLTIEELYDLSARLAFILKQEGVLPGDYVVSTVPLSLESAIVTFGIIFAGAVPANLPLPLPDRDQFFTCLQKLKSRLLIVRDEPDGEIFKLFKPTVTVTMDFHSKIKSASISVNQLTSLKRMLFVGRSERRGQSFLERLETASNDYIYEGINPQTVAFLHASPGTFKQSSITMTDMTHLNATRTMDSMQVIKLKPYSKRLYASPWYCFSALPHDFLSGTTRVFPDNWCPIQDYPLMLLNIVTTEEIDYVYLESQNVSEMLKIRGPGQTKPLFDQLVITDIPITKNKLPTLRAAANCLTALYGCHESGPTFYHHIKLKATDFSQSFDTRQDVDIGKPLPGVQFRIVDENWKDVEPGQFGRMLLKSPGMLHRLPGEPVKTSQIFDPDFWLITNNKGRVDPGGNHLYVKEIVLPLTGAALP